ncbi:UPF0502 protein [Psychromonas marina]|uniref:UPF0502 protein n=2 Tax=Psychromonas marina TaxID=88364 RepID=A0ABQ6E1F3_9GAMM|nr:UPF0502 protein [Psychromonas marina]
MMNLTALQTRIIGVMLEKESTTPEHYPLSLNALTNACNQKSNREPVLSLTEMEVQNAVDELIDMNKLMIDSGASGRVNKYKHRFCNTSFGDLQFTAQQKSIVCVLLLRGPQTPGELRTRTNRLANFANVTEVESALEQLQNLNNKTLVKKLAREPGKRESRYVHLFSEFTETEFVTDQSALLSSEQTKAGQGQLEVRVEQLEQQVVELQAELTRLAALFE